MTNNPLRIGILGAGGLGKAAAKIISMKRQARLTLICDSRGLVVDPDGLDGQQIAALPTDVAAGYAPRRSSGRLIVRPCDDPLEALVPHLEHVDGLFIALPNLPNAFIPNIIRSYMDRGLGLTCVDALKRTSAVELMFELDALAKQSRSVYLTGCGATPGLLTAAAVLAAQSFITVESVEIWWGVGMDHWESHKATIREDIAHLPGYSVERAQAMSDAEVAALLERTNGRLELHGMEHADDLLLQRAGVVASRDQVEVGGVMDTRSATKPVTTTMTLTGITADGRRSSHQLVLGDETTMAANVIGPALGYLQRARWLKDHGIFGVFGSTEFMPMVVT